MATAMATSDFQSQTSSFSGAPKLTAEDIQSATWKIGWFQRLQDNGLIYAYKSKSDLTRIFMDQCSFWLVQKLVCCWWSRMSVSAQPTSIQKCLPFCLTISDIELWGWWSSALLWGGIRIFSISLILSSEMFYMFTESSKIQDVEGLQPVAPPPSQVNISFWLVHMRWWQTC